MRHHHPDAYTETEFTRIVRERSREYRSIFFVIKSISMEIGDNDPVLLDIGSKLNFEVLSTPNGDGTALLKLLRKERT